MICCSKFGAGAAKSPPGSHLDPTLLGLSGSHPVVSSAMPWCYDSTERLPLEGRGVLGLKPLSGLRPPGISTLYPGWFPLPEVRCRRTVGSRAPAPATPLWALGPLALGLALARVWATMLLDGSGLVPSVFAVRHLIASANSSARPSKAWDIAIERKGKASAWIFFVYFRIKVHTSLYEASTTGLLKWLVFYKKILPVCCVIYCITTFIRQIIPLLRMPPW